MAARTVAVPAEVVGLMRTAVCGQFLIRMTIQTMSGIGTQGYCINNLLSWAVVTGRTGTVPVGGYIMLGSLYLRPVSHNMTAAA